MPIPLLAAALPTIGSFLAEKGMSLLSSIFKGSVDSGMKKIADTIQEKTGININDAAEGKLTEEQIIKLKQFELEHEQMLLDHIKEIKTLEIEEEKLSVQDRMSARDMQKAAMAQDDKFVKRFIYYYATFITLVTFAFIFVIIFVKIDDKNMRIVDTVLGFLLGVSLSAIIQFFFGSSKGSSEKQQHINDLTSQLAEMSKNKK